MRASLVVALSAFTVAASVVSAGAMPLAPTTTASQAAKIIEVAGGCGWGMHRYHGRCLGHHSRPYAFYRRDAMPYPYYGGGYGPLNRPTPGDHVANQLNAHEMGY